MWHALKAELAYFRPWMLWGFALAAGIVVLLHVLLHLFGEGETVPPFLPAMFPILAGMVVSFVAQSYRFEERRVRLLLKGSLTPRQLGQVIVLLPICLVGAGILVATLVVILGNLASANPDAPTFRTLGVLGGQFLVYALLGTLIQEAVTAQLQDRRRSAVATWIGIVVTVPIITTFYWLESRPALYIASYALVAAMIMIGTVKLYEGRKDFTR
jgi:hypothetical protein